MTTDNYLIGLPGLAGDVYLAAREVTAAHRHHIECMEALAAAAERLESANKRARQAEDQLKAHVHRGEP